MMTGNFLHHCKRLIIIMLLLFFSSGSSFSQKKLSGVLYQPSTQVTSFGTSSVIVNNVTGFNVGDTVLLIQMQGVEIYTDLANYGVLVSKIGEPGLHEFMKVLTVDVGLKTITFWNDIKNAYNLLGNLQIVRVPFYNSAIVTGTLTSNPWDPVSKSGGVLSIIIGRTIKLQANIDMSGKGFSGGSNSTGTGICQSSDPVAYTKDFYDASDANSGYKGEGAANYALSIVPTNDPIFPGYMKGQGPSFNGGGGGNGRYSGGGGGANIGSGGKGGKEDKLSCSSQGFGGSGGQTIDPLNLPKTIFPGGGGGSSTSALAGGSGSGGNGGGIVIIVTDTIIGKGGNIISNGGNGGNATGLAGAGGGGGGGTIALSANSYGPVSDPIKFYVKGGNGGNSDAAINCEGGGGGGGLVWVSKVFTSNANAVSTEGIRGTPGSPFNNPASPGNASTDFTAVLNGFLYNSIRSSVTGDPVDSICNGDLSPRITGTIPFGGTPGYTILWEKSITSESAGYSTIVGVTSNDYTPPGLLVQTTWFRRTVTDNSAPAIVDISKPVKIIVQPAITGNLVGSDQIICWNQNPDNLIPLNAGPTGGSSHNYYLYKWLQNTVDAGWNPTQVAMGTATSASYDPPALVSTKYYKRFVTSGRCIDYGPTVTITVLNSITGNIWSPRPDSVLCEGFAFPALQTSMPGQGNGSYLYQWQDSTHSSPWSTASGSSTAAAYTPDTSKFTAATQSRFYRRIVFSGPQNVCKSTSLPVDLTRYPNLKNNLVNANPADLTICSGSTPVALPGSNPSDGEGAGSYSFIWEWSPDGSSFIPAPGVNNSVTGNYQPPLPLTADAWYLRIVNSGVYKTNVVCTNTSPTIKITVNPPILTNTISVSGVVKDTICNDQQPGIYQGSVVTGGIGIYIYQWLYSPDNSVFTSVPTAGTGVNYLPPQLTATTYYQRQVTSGACITNSNSITETVLPVITNNIISGNPRVCYTKVPDLITGATLAGGSGTYKYFWRESTDGGTNWAAASGTNASAVYQPPALSVPIKYERTVTSGKNGCCTNISNTFDISIDPLPASTINAGPDALIQSILNNYQMQATKPLSGETGVWKILNNGASVIEDSSSYNTTVDNLSSQSVNSFLWTVSNGLCKLSDSVNIDLLKIIYPQGFSPNGDTHNDTFIIEGLNLVDNDADLIVVNGAGTEVFKNSSRNNETWADWNGKNSSGNDLPEGTYYYMLNITSKKPNGAHSKISGFIVLKRY